MQVTAKLSNLRISPRKVRLIAELIRGESVERARQQLSVQQKQAARPMLKLLNSAVANAEHNFNLNPDNLYIKQVLVNQGQTLKRYRPRAFGRATEIQKKASHIQLILDEIEEISQAPVQAAADKEKKKEKEEPKKKKAKKTTTNSKKKAKATPPADATPDKDPKKVLEENEQAQKEQPFDPRRVGHERPTQHKDKKNKKIIKT